MISRRVASACALAVLVFGGCGSSSEDAALETLSGDDGVQISSRERLTVDVRPAGAIRLGKNTFIVSFPASADAELASVAALMPAHGHGSPPPAIEHTADGFVVRDVVLYMSGRWELRLALRVGPQEDEAIVAVDVP